MRRLGLVPARGGSKGIPRKNIKPMAGKPLIAWTIEAALASGTCDSLVVSTDDEEIAETARRWGAQVPFLRPPELARDDTPGVDVVLHALAALPGHDAVLLLQPTSPLRTAADITAFVAHVERSGAPCVISVCEPAHHPGWMYTLGDGERLKPLLEGPVATRRQDFAPVYAANGALYHARRDWLERTRSFITPETAGWVMPPERSVDLDTPLDWKFAELLLKESLA